MKFYPADHSVACQSHALICAVENLRDIDGQTSFDFRVAVQDNQLKLMADSYLDLDESFVWDVCKCHVVPMLRVIERIKVGEPHRAQEMAQAFLDNREITLDNYITLVKWTEGRVA